MTAPDSSSTAASRSEPASVDLLQAGLLASLPAAFYGGRDLDLLAPLRLLPAGELPAGRPPQIDRGALAAALGVANAAYGHPAAHALAARLADPATRVVVTGQQPGLFGGPLYTLSKAVAAARWAAALEASGGPAVAVFWMATEDHDFAEIASTTLIGAEGPFTVGLGDDPSPLLPVGMRTLGPAVRGALDDARRLPGERWAAWIDQLARRYRPEARFGEAFARLLVDLLGPRCPLLLDAMLPEVKLAQRPWLERLVTQRSEVEAAYRETDAEIVARGHALQVSPQPGSSPLFLLRDSERRRIEWRGDDRFSLRGLEGSERPVGELERTLADNPAVVSAGVLARPVVQDAILGTTLQVLGPAELSYLPQTRGVYAVLGVEAPFVTLRPQALVLDRRQLENLAASGVALEELVMAEFDVERAVARLEGADPVAAARDGLDSLLAQLKAAAVELDPGLERQWEKTRDQVWRSLEAFGGKVAGAAARRHDVLHRRLLGLRQICRPEGKLQERVVSTAQFPGKYGERFPEAMWEQLALSPTRLQVIVP